MTGEGKPVLHSSSFAVPRSPVAVTLASRDKRQTQSHSSRDMKRRRKTDLEVEDDGRRSGGEGLASLQQLEESRELVLQSRGEGLVDCDSRLHGFVHLQQLLLHLMQSLRQLRRRGCSSGSRGRESRSRGRGGKEEVRLLRRGSRGRSAARHATSGQQVSQEVDVFAQETRESRGRRHQETGGREGDEEARVVGEEVDADRRFRRSG